MFETRRIENHLLEPSEIHSLSKVRRYRLKYNHYLGRRIQTKRALRISQTTEAIKLISEGT